MSDNSYNIFLKEINFDNETNSVYLDEHGIMIHLDVHHMNLDESYADMDEVEKGNFLIKFNHTSRPTKELLFDFYHETAKILIYLEKLDLRAAEGWLKTKDYINEISNISYMVKELTADKFAFEKLTYTGQINKLIPLKKSADMIKRNKEVDPNLIKAGCIRINRERTIRRRYLDYLAGSNIPLKKQSRQVGNAEWNALSNRPQKTHLDGKDVTHSIAHGDLPVIKEKKVFIETPLMIFCKRVGINYSEKDTFDELCKRIIKCVTCDTSRSAYNIPSDTYERVEYEPSDWVNNYTKYFKYNTDVCKYVKIPKSDIPLEFNSNVYRRKPVNESEAIAKIKERYSRMVKEFLIPWYEKYNNMYSVKDRHEIEYIVENAMIKHLHDYMIPSSMEINNLRDDYKGISNLGENIKKATATMMTHKEKAAACKDRYPQRENESDEAYNKRIDNLVFSGKWHVKTKNV